MRGVVRSIIGDKGFGFIKNPESGQEYFFHKTDYQGNWQDLVEDTLRHSVEVEFETFKAPKGPRAANVNRVTQIHP